jgi:hypothetical protein
VGGGLTSAFFGWASLNKNEQWLFSWGGNESHFLFFTRLRESQTFRRWIFEISRGHFIAWVPFVSEHRWQMFTTTFVHVWWISHYIMICGLTELHDFSYFKNASFINIVQNLKYHFPNVDWIRCGCVTFWRKVCVAWNWWMLWDTFLFWF